MKSEIEEVRDELRAELLALLLVSPGGVLPDYGDDSVIKRRTGFMIAEAVERTPRKSRFSNQATKP
jgi:hypothetical protein